MTYTPTSWVTVLKDSEGTDAYGDDTDVYTAVRTGVGTHIAERNKSVFDPATGRSMTRRVLTALLPYDLAVEAGWRLKDERTGVYFFIEHVVKPTSFTGHAPIRAELERVE